MMRPFLRSYSPYLALAAAVVLPLLPPGYILTLDAVFVPHLPAPDGVSSDFLWRWALHLLNFIIPSQLIEKAIFAAIPLVAAIGAHRLAVWVLAQLPKKDTRLAARLAPYAAGGLYAVNPFTYDRFMAGQYGVLLGYMLLPFAVQAWLSFVRRPAERSGLVRVVALAVGISIVSLPTIGELAVVALCIVGAALWQARRQPRHARTLALRSGLVLALFVVLSSYWLLPALLGKGEIAQQVGGFTSAHTAAFATLGDTGIGKVLHVLRLQGFWAEAQQLFVLPQNQLPGWGTVRLAVWALVVAGGVVLWRRKRALAAPFVGMAVIAVALAAGAFGGLLTRLGYREPQKFTGVVALVFALFLAVGAARLFGWARTRAERHYTTAACAVLLVVLLFTPTMYWGFAGQLHPRNYPADYTAANEYLNSQPGNFAAVFLPWHQYMSFRFADRVIATPAPLFFDRPVFASNNPELGKITPPAGELATRIGELVAPEAPAPNLAQGLARHNVRYVLLAKDYDYRRYSYLDSQRALRIAKDYPTLRIYENTGWKGGE